MSRIVSFTVSGKPIPQGSHIARATRARVDSEGELIQGKAYLHDDQAAELRKWRRAVRDEALKHYSSWMRQSPVVAVMKFMVGDPPKGRSVGDWAPVRRGDLSKLIRAVEDALVDGKVLIDDAQIVFSVGTKVYGGPGVHVTVLDVGRHADEISRLVAALTEGAAA